MNTWRVLVPSSHHRFTLHISSLITHHLNSTFWLFSDTLGLVTGPSPDLLTLWANLDPSPSCTLLVYPFSYLHSLDYSSFFRSASWAPSTVCLAKWQVLNISLFTNNNMNKQRRIKAIHNSSRGYREITDLLFYTSTTLMIKPEETTFHIVSYS